MNATEAEVDTTGWPLLVDGDRRWRIPPGKFSTLMGHGLLGKRADGAYRLCDTEELERDPGSAGVNNPKALAVLAVVRAALSAQPLSTLQVQTSEADYSDGIAEAVLNEGFARTGDTHQALASPPADLREALSDEDIRLIHNIKWESIDRDNMEFKARVSCYQREALDRLIALTMSSSERREGP